VYIWELGGDKFADVKSEIGTQDSETGAEEEVSDAELS
jgi:hypothetical protein